MTRSFRFAAAAALLVAALFADSPARAAGNPAQPLPVAASASVSGGATGFFNDAVTTAVQIKATRGQIYALSLTNGVAATSYLQVFCLPSASVTLGTTVADFTFRLISSAARDIPVDVGLCGAGSGITVAGTTTPTGNTTAAISVFAAFK